MGLTHGLSVCIPGPPIVPFVGEGWGEGASPEASQALEEFWRQATLARATYHFNKRLSWYVDPREGHDDLLVSLALAVEAAEYSRPRVAIGRRRPGSDL